MATTCSPAYSSSHQSATSGSICTFSSPLTAASGSKMASPLKGKTPSWPG